jgi:HlyD family secretion protein
MNRWEKSMRTTVRLGGVVALLFFGGLGGWAAYAPISGAAIAPGVISPDGERRAVQHLDGGIVQMLLVHEGSDVDAGQPLLILDPSASQASRELLQKELLGNLAIRARLVAERDNADAVAYPDELRAGKPEVEAQGLMDMQSALFLTRSGARNQKKEVLRQQITQHEQAILGFEQQRSFQLRQLALLRDEASDIAPLVAKGLERKPRLLALQRTEAEVSGNLASTVANAAKSRQAIAEASAQIDAVETDYKQEVGGKLAEVEATLAGVREKLRAASDVLGRTVIAAPLAGTVVSLKANTVGGVVVAGQTILEIVPRDEELLVDARVSPNDIDEVRPGLPARVVMTGYSQRTTPPLVGKVRHVSADRFVDDKTNQPYYLVRIELSPEHVRAAGAHVSIKPGMPAEVMVLTAERTMLDYLVEPLVASIRRSFRES